MDKWGIDYGLVYVHTYYEYIGKYMYSVHSGYFTLSVHRGNNKVTSISQLIHCYYVHTYIHTYIHT